MKSFKLSAQRTRPFTKFVAFSVVALAVLNIPMCKVTANGTAARVVPAATTRAPGGDDGSSAAVSVPSWSWYESHGHIIAEGQVKSESVATLHRLKVLVQCYDDSGTFVTSDYNYIEYKSLLRGQTSPFKVYLDGNPAIAACDMQPMRRNLPIKVQGSR